MAINFFTTALATSITMLVVSRLVGGAMQANAAVANAYVADITPPAERAKRFGLLGAMFGIGFILGPVMGGMLGGIDLRLPFFVAGVLALANLAYGWFVLPESLPPAQRRPVDWWQANPLSSFKKLVALKGVGLLVGVLGFCRPGAVQPVHGVGAVRQLALRLGPGRERLVAVRGGHGLGGGAGWPARPAAQAASGRSGWRWRVCCRPAWPLSAGAWPPSRG